MHDIIITSRFSHFSCLNVVFEEIVFKLYFLKTVFYTGMFQYTFTPLRDGV